MSPITPSLPLSSDGNSPANNAHVPVVVIIGAGPRGVGVLERIAAQRAARNDTSALTIHLVDPFPPGPGRIWRHDQSEHLRLNSFIEEITVFTDSSVTTTGPAVPGPTMWEWVQQYRQGLLLDVRIDDAAVHREVAEIQPGSFPSRRLHSYYLSWFYRWVVDKLGSQTTVLWHQTKALRVRYEGPDRRSPQHVTLENGEELTADVVLYTLGHSGRTLTTSQVQVQAFARSHELSYIPPDFTADTDLSRVPEASNVIVRGMGLAAIDLVALLTLGRGGSFFTGADGKLEYQASGHEPVLYLASRRGVPYRAKMPVSKPGITADLIFLTEEAVGELLDSQATIDFDRDIWPLIIKDLLWNYYRELFNAHPSKTVLSWGQFADQAVHLEADSAEYAALIRQAVPDPLDRLTIDQMERPFEQLPAESLEAFQRQARDYLKTELRLRSESQFSAQQALFTTALNAMRFVSDISLDVWSAKSRAVSLPVRWVKFFSFVANGPPAHRLAELEALSRAGVVVFLGKDVWLRCDDAEGQFVAGSGSVTDEVRARFLVDAWLPDSQASESDSPALKDIVESQAGAELQAQDEVFSGTNGQVVVQEHTSQLLDRLGKAHPRRFAVGPFTNLTHAGAFSRPHTNALPFRENDWVAEGILTELSKNLETNESNAATDDATDGSPAGEGAGNGPQLVG